MLKEINYKSLDNITNIHACIWEPTTQINAILQISHGMIDHIKRYSSFAEELNRYGILVCGNDHLGHGTSVIDKEHYGYFAANDSVNIVVDDTYSLTKIIKEKYPNIPYFVLGHSMGSFIIRNYIAKYGNEINGSIIMGSAIHSSLKMTLAKILTTIIQFYHRGWFYRSKYLARLTTGNFHKYFDNDKNKFCWLTKNQDILKAYENDPLCNFRFTCNGFYTLYSLIQTTNKTDKLINKNLPLLLCSGKDDPVGKFGKHPTELAKRYNKFGIKDVKVKIYNNMRHEILNESDRLIVINDIVQFINLKRFINSKRETQ